MDKEEWVAIGRIMLYCLRVGYFPLYISEAFMVCVIFGDSAVNEDLLLLSFKMYLSSEERDTIKEMLQIFMLLMNIC